MRYGRGLVDIDLAFLFDDQSGQELEDFAAGAAGLDHHAVLEGESRDSPCEGRIRRRDEPVHEASTAGLQLELREVVNETLESCLEDLGLPGDLLLEGVIGPVL